MMISSPSVPPKTRRCSSSIRRDQKPERLRRSASGFPAPSNGVHLLGGGQQAGGVGIELEDEDGAADFVLREVLMASLRGLSSGYRVGLTTLGSRRAWRDHACRSAVIAGPCAWTGPGGPGPGPPSAVAPAGRDRDRHLGGRVPGGRGGP